MLCLNVVLAKPYSVDLSEEIHTKKKYRGNEEICDTGTPEEGARPPISLLSTGGVILAIAFFSSLIKDAFHMTARK